MHESNLPKNPNSGDDGHASEAAEPGSINHATEIYGCAYAWALLPRVLLATPCGRWRLLSGLPAVRRGIQVRLDHHAPHRACGTCQAGYWHSPEPHARETSLVGTPCAPPEAGHPAALSREQDQHLVRRHHRKHQPEWSPLPWTAAVAGKRVGGNGIRDARGDFGTEEQQRSL